MRLDKAKLGPRESRPSTLFNLGEVHASETCLVTRERVKSHTFPTSFKMSRAAVRERKRIRKSTTSTEETVLLKLKLD